MSQLKVNSVVDASGGNTATINSMTPTADSLQGFRNRLINGAMVIDQRNAGASISFASGDGTYCLDRWRLQRSGAGTMTVQQVSSAPTGFVNSLKFTVTGTSTPGAGDFYTFGQIIEGFNSADLAWGTASAQTVTLSFWINSSVTGTYSASLYSFGGSNAYPATFTVSAANTWEYKTIVIPGATAGTWATTNAGSIYFRIDLGSGSNYSTATANAWNTSGFFRTNSSVNFISNASATLSVTGFQLEVGSTATPFERRDYGRELIMCQRYFQSFTKPCLRGAANTTSAINRLGMPTLVTMRTAPTIVLSGTFDWFDGTVGGTFTALSSQYSTVSSVEIDSTAATGVTAANRPITVYVGGNTGTLTASSEL